MKVVETSIQKVLNDWKHGYKYTYLIDTNNNHRHHYESKLTYEEGFGWWFFDPVLNQIEYIKSDQKDKGVTIKIITIHGLIT